MGKKRGKGSKGGGAKGKRAARGRGGAEPEPEPKENWDILGEYCNHSQHAALIRQIYIYYRQLGEKLGAQE